MISALTGIVPATDFGSDSPQKTLIWRAGVVLCDDEKNAARFACGTVNIGAILSNPPSEPTFEHLPHQQT